MPVEGQWTRVKTPLRSRDRRALAALAALCAAAAVAAGTVYATASGAPAADRCLVVDVPSTMGGARLKTCGYAAHRFCRTEGRNNSGIAAACMREGYGTDVRRP
jgi:hypothetical protein